MDRVTKLLPRAKGSPQSNMSLLLGYLTPSGIVPDMDKYYVFVYKPKTPNIEYDRHPFIVCTSVYQWGFIGVNFHWGQHRRYTWKECRSNLYEISPEEIEPMKRYPIAKFQRS